jgi:hypothetical protein
MDIKELETIEAENKEYKYMVHDGYLGWSYGCPQFPLIISRKTAIKIFMYFEKSTGKDAVAEMKNHILDFVYTEKGSELYFKTGENRIIGLYNPEECVFKNENYKERIFDFDI